MQPEEFISRKFREYTLTDIIGVGGMGAVYKAYHDRLKTIRAIKVLRTECSTDEQFKGRFEREARILARLDSPHLIRIYEFFEEESRLFLVMEYASGESLADLLSYQNSLPIPRAINLIQQACEGLVVAHRQGIIHRDLSPDNVMISKTEEDQDLVKIIDFGIAKDSGTEVSSTLMASELTTPGLFLGKVKYCSPEQAMGKEIDHRSDQYTLALILYESITGVCAFQGETPMETLTMRLHEPPPKFSQIRPGSSYSSFLEDVVFKAMDRLPENRYEDILAFRDALSSALLAEEEDDFTLDKRLVLDSDIIEDDPKPEGIAAAEGIPLEFNPPESEEEKLELTSLYEDIGRKPAPPRWATPMEPVRVRDRTVLRRPVPGVAPPRKRRRWIWVLAVMILMMAGAGGYGYYSGIRDWAALKQSASLAYNSAKGKIINYLPKARPDERTTTAAKSKPAKKTKSANTGHKLPSKKKMPWGDKASGSNSKTDPYWAGSPGIIAPEVVKRVEAKLPDGVNVRLPATVIVEVVVFKEGNLGTMVVLQSVHPLVDQAAMESIRKWTFRGGFKNGEPADIIMDIPIEFR